MLDSVAVSLPKTVGHVCSRTVLLFCSLAFGLSLRGCSREGARGNQRSAKESARMTGGDDG